MPRDAAREARGAQSFAGAARDWGSPLFQGFAFTSHPARGCPSKREPSHPRDGQEKLGAKGFILAGNKSGGDLFF